MNAFRYHAPLDPGCTEVEHAFQIPMTDEETGEEYWIEDPYASMCGEELYDDFETKHRLKCERCRTFGVENIEVVGP